MKNTILAGLLAVAFAMPAMAETPEEIANKYPGYKLAFQDEFEQEDGTVPDHDVWNFEKGFKRNNEGQYYIDRVQNSFIRDGKLVIRALDDTTKNPAYSKYGTGAQAKKTCYTSASMQSKSRYHYGIWETCAKLTPREPNWPAIWGTGNSRGWPQAGELDIMEYYGDAIHANLCWGGRSNGGDSWNSKAPRMAEFDKDFGDKFHIWRCEWDYNSCRIYLDDRLLNDVDLDQTKNFDGYNPFRDENNTFQVWLNLAIGGNNGGNPAKGQYPEEYIVEYTRVYTPEGPDAAITYHIHKAQTLLDNTVEGDGPMQYPTEARQALQAAMDEAAKKLGTPTNEELDEVINNMKAAIATYQSSMSVGIKVGETFSLRHIASNAFLSTGWVSGGDQNYQDYASVIVLNPGHEGYNQQFTLVKSPNGNGTNLRTGDGKYVFRKSWYLLVNENPSEADLNKNDYLFNVETADGHIVIKSVGSGKYFGSDDTTEWAHLYSDKAGAGNAKAYFELADPSGIENVTIDAEAENQTISAIYNLQGIYAGTSTEALAGNHTPYIVVRGKTATKEIF